MLTEVEQAAQDVAISMIEQSTFIGVFWWVLLCFLYIGTHNSDELSQKPFLWMWKNLNSNRMGWLAAAYMTNFVLYGVIIGTEFVGLEWMKMGDGTLLAFWLKPWAYWLSMTMLWGPPFLAMMQLTLTLGQGGIESDQDAETYDMDWFFMFWGYVGWIYQMVIHIMFAEDAQKYASHVVKQCVCHEAHVKKGATLAERMAAEDYARDRCEEKCGMPEMTCGIARSEGESYADYKKKCRGARKGAEPALTKVASPSASADDGW